MPSALRRLALLALLAWIGLTWAAAPARSARAVQVYGLILADNGSAWYVSGAPDARWNNDVLHELDVIHGSDFEAVDEAGLMVDPNSGQAKP